MRHVVHRARRRLPDDRDEREDDHRGDDPQRDLLLRRQTERHPYREPHRRVRRRKIGEAAETMRASGFDARTALRTNNVCRHLSNLAPRKNSDASLANAVVEVVLVAEHRDTAAVAEDEMLIDDERRRRALARDRLYERSISLANDIVTGVVVCRAAVV